MAWSLRYYTHPVYNALGRQIGYYESDDKLCTGRIQMITSEKDNAGDPETWKVKVWGVLKPINQVCVSRGVVPVWMTQEQAKDVQQNLKPINIPDNLPVVLKIDGGKVVPIAVAGGLGIVALILLTRR